MSVILTALTAFAVLTVGGSNAGQTREAQENSKSDVQLVAQYNHLVEKQVRWLTMIGKQPKKVKRATCKDAEKAIVHYRQKVWDYQYLLGEKQSLTKHQERLKNACGYKRHIAKKWQALARVYFDEMKRLKANPYKLARMIVYSIFPKETAEAALTVVDCETGGTYDESATNRTSGVRGYFQIHPGNHGRVFYWKGKRLVLDASRLYDPWYNTTVAVFMTSGGKHWHEWHCQPYVGIG